MASDHIEIAPQEPPVLPRIDMLPAGFVFQGRFEIISFLGKGGMCVVYKARDLDIHRDVALKMLHRHLVVDAEAIERFRREAVAVTALEHPNIVKVHSFGCWHAEGPYISMEYLDGTSLAEILKKETRLPRDKALSIFEQILDALAHAHKKGVIHRDLKPSNVMLVGPQQTTVKLVDFGIAKILPASGRELQKLTQTGALFGTVSYMSPEQCLSEPLDCRSDIYSMGCLMYEVLEGAPPLQGETPMSAMHKHLTEEPKKTARLNDEFGSVVLSALAKDRESRPQSASELKAALLSPATYKAPISKPRADSRRLHHIFSILLMLGCVGITSLWLAWRRAGTQVAQETPQKKDYASPDEGLEKSYSLIRTKDANSVSQALRIDQKLLDDPEAAPSERLQALQNLAEHSPPSSALEWAYKFRDAVEQQKPDHITTWRMGAITALAQAHIARQQYADAIPLLKRVLDHLENVHGANSPDVVVVLVPLADAYQSLHNYTQAEPCYKRALAIMENKPGRINATLRVALLQHYALLLRKANRGAEAEQYEARARDPSQSKVASP